MISLPKRYILVTLGILLVGIFLRFYKIGQIPIALHGDEVGVGYNAYSLIRAGVDEYGSKMPIVFRADVTPLIFYVAVPFIKLLGATDRAVRLPSAFIGMLTLLMGMVFTYQFFRFSNQHKDRNNIRFATKLSMLVGLLIAVSPFQIQINRIAHDGQYGNLTQLIALSCLVHFFRKKSSLSLLISGAFWGLSIYAYHAPRLTTPLLLLIIFALYRKQFSKFNFAIILCSTLVCVAPYLNHLLTHPLKETRISGISFITDLRAQHAPLIKYPETFIKNFFTQFSPQYLFLDSSAARYFNVEGIGLIYLGELPFCLYFLFVSVKKKEYFISFLIMLSVLPGAITTGPPNPGRNSLFFIFFEIASGFGLALFLKNHSLKVVSHTQRVFAFLLFLELFFFLEAYFIAAPLKFFTNWQYGYKEVAQRLITLEHNTEHIVVSSGLKQMYIYILFYGQKDPRWLLGQSNLERAAFIGYSQFGNFIFRPIKWNVDQQLSNTLFVGLPNEVPREAASEIIRSPTGKELIYIIRNK